MRLSREKILRLSHLILDYLDKDDAVEYFAAPQEVRQDVGFRLTRQNSYDRRRVDKHHLFPLSSS